VFPSHPNFQKIWVKLSNQQQAAVGQSLAAVAEKELQIKNYLNLLTM
jgi:hypothetical protein